LVKPGGRATRCYTAAAAAAVVRAIEILSTKALLARPAYLARQELLVQWGGAGCGKFEYRRTF
jgi:hypothetical protein